MDASDGWAKRRRQEGGVRPGGSAPRARNVKALRRRAATTPAMATLSLVLSSSLLLLLLSLSLGVAGGVSGEYEWKECAVSPRDEWKQALADIPALRMRYDYERRYTCDQEKASYLAASYYFDSPCMRERFLQPADAHSCLRGRRIMFLGDSLANQQGDSLLGMLGWHPEFLTRGAPRNEKLGVDEDGHYYNTMVDCWHPADHWKIGWVERCYDYYSSDFPTPMPAVSGQRAWSWEGDSEKKAPSLNVVGRRQDEPEEEDGFSVHMRMLSRPRGSQWFERAVLDYNETRSSDVFVVNFGAHYHFPPGEDDDELFKADVAPILDAMAELGDKATVVWREISPTHFPAENGTYDAFVSNQDGNPIEVNTCCTGTPPKVLDRNLWVENYLRDNGLMDRVKLLRIYDMSRTRGSAHHTCHLAPPSTMDQRKAAKNRCRAVGMPDCVHWSETGVVEEWNRLLLNHICSSSEGGVAARGP